MKMEFGFRIKKQVKGRPTIEEQSLAESEMLTGDLNADVEGCAVPHQRPESVSLQGAKY